MNLIRATLLSFLCLSLPVAHLFAAEKPWTEIRSEHFRVLTDGSENDARRLAREFEQLRTVFSNTMINMRLESGAPLTIFAPKDEESAKTLQPMLWKGGRTLKPGGLYHHGSDREYAWVRIDAMRNGNYGVAYHEYTHSLLHLNFSYLPTWLDEGMADYYGSTRFEKSKIYVGAPNTGHLKWLHSELAIPLDTLLAVDHRSPYYREEYKGNTFYAESWALVHYLRMSETAGRGQKLYEFIMMLQRGVEQKKAFEQCFGSIKSVEERLHLYENQVTYPSWGMPNPTNIDESTFTVRHLTVGETEAEIGGFRLFTNDPDTLQWLNEALRDAPDLALAHENMGIYHQKHNEDADAAREFARAFELDGHRFLSLYYMTMLSPGAHSSDPAAQASFRDGMEKTLALNPQYAPADVQLAELSLREGKPQAAVSYAIKAEKLEPAQIEYYLLLGRVALATGHPADAAKIAKFVADRWLGREHDNAVKLWNSVPADQRPAGETLADSSASTASTADQTGDTATADTTGSAATNAATPAVASTPVPGATPAPTATPTANQM